MSGAGTSSQNQNSQVTQNYNNTQAGSSNPWGPAMPELSDIIQQLGTQGLAPTTNQTNAANNLVSAAGMIPNLGPSAAGAIQSYLNPNFTNPYNNPALRNAFDALNQQIGSGIAGQFAGAGRDPSGNAQAPEAIARGEAQAEAPILANEYNSLLGFQQNALPMISQLPGDYTQAAATQGNAANVQAQLPLQNLVAALGATLPIAGLGGSYSASGKGTNFTQGNQNTTNTASPLQDIASATGAFGNIFGGANPAYAGFANFLKTV